MHRESAQRLMALLGERFGGRKLVVVSNREPVVHMRRAKGGPPEVLKPASGLTTAMEPVLMASGGIWVAHGSGTADFDEGVIDGRDGLGWPPEDPRFRLRRVRLRREVEQGYYYGLSNEGIWPLCHIAYTAPIFRHSDWAMYREANQAFADAVLDEIGSEPSVVFVNDYHLGLLPRMLRRARPDILIAHFWHIPWPNREVLRVMPWIEELLDGLLGNDLLGFHVQHHCNNFLDTVDRGIECLVDYEHHRATRGGHSTFVRPFPISIDAAGYAETAKKRPFEEVFPDLAEKTKNQILLLGVDRLDYTKGIPHRLRIVEALLDKHPDLRGRVTLVQVGAPTRTAIPRYASLAEEVLELVGSINDKFQQDDWKPIHFLAEHHDRDALASLYRRADGCLVTSLHDGMNLVAKEYVAAHAGKAGILMLSKYTGAARDLFEACLVNPYDIEGSADVLAETLRLPEAVRAEAMDRLYNRVCAHDVFDWAASLFRALSDVSLRREAMTFPGN
ncbi:MAG: trehalose-6-phosphate synthase [Polyangiaceae bacterium]|nr:trehalose-6-phosphate synthase [Polyangiaceae bacterium]